MVTNNFKNNLLESGSTLDVYLFKFKDTVVPTEALAILTAESLFKQTSKYTHKYTENS